MVSDALGRAGYEQHDAGDVSVGSPVSLDLGKQGLNEKWQEIVATLSQQLVREFSTVLGVKSLFRVINLPKFFQI